MKKVSEIMTKDPVCCTPQDSVTEAAQLMKREDIGSVPVIQDRRAKKLVGIVTDRDLALKVLAEGRNPNNIRVEEIMTRNPLSCREDDDLEDCLDSMEKRQIRRMPIVDSQDRIIGIIAQADVATRAGEPGKTAELVEEISG
jgi:CBS domain-containing protein